MKYNKYKKYNTVGEWWEKDGAGKFPIQIPIAISKLEKEKGLSFHEAFEQLVKKEVIVFVDNEQKK